MIRYVFILAALASVFLFPYPATLFLSFVAGAFFPPMPLITGILVDLYYHVPGAAVLPWGTVWGLVLSLVCVGVRRFVKARIIG